MAVSEVGGEYSLGKLSFENSLFFFFKSHTVGQIISMEKKMCSVCVCFSHFGLIFPHFIFDMQIVSFFLLILWKLFKFFCMIWFCVESALMCLESQNSVGRVCYLWHCNNSLFCLLPHWSFSSETMWLQKEQHYPQKLLVCQNSKISSKKWNNI